MAVENGDEPVALSPRLADFTLLYFFVWNYLKKKVYRMSITNEEELVGWIQEACNYLRRDNHLIAAPNKMSAMY